MLCQSSCKYAKCLNKIFGVNDSKIIDKIYLNILCTKENKKVTSRDECLYDYNTFKLVRNGEVVLNE